MNYHETVRGRIEAKLVLTDSGCQEWQGALDGDGYGFIKVEGKLPRVHKVMYELCVGDVPVGMVLRHTCDNRKCCNPEHLVLGTIAQNNKDRAVRNSSVGKTQERHREPGTLEQRFWAKVDKTGECWLWLGTKNADGYGAFKVQYRMRKAHRVAYELCVGPVPEGLCVLHKCDNTSCVNPEHLFVGTRTDNAADRDSKGRNRTGHTTGKFVPPPSHLRSAIMLDRAARGEAHGTKTHPEKITRGDKHWSRTNPEKRPTGERHGSFTHPEAVLRGEDAPWSKLTQAQVDSIRTEYRMGGISQDALGRKYNISQTQISRIIKGIRWAH